MPYNKQSKVKLNFIKNQQFSFIISFSFPVLRHIHS